MMAYAVSEGRLFWLKPSEWSAPASARRSADSDARFSDQHSPCRQLVDTRKLNAIIRISASVRAMRRSLCKPRRSRDCMRLLSWPLRSIAYSLARPRDEEFCLSYNVRYLFGAERAPRCAAD